MKKTNNTNIDGAPAGSIRTNSGTFVNVFDTNPDSIKIEDIAHALSRLPRFGGHLNRHYSVAQHSVLCAQMAKTKKDKKAALLHDGSEAFLLDMPTPIKARMGEYKQYEDKLMTIIFKKYDLEWPLSNNIKKIDRKMLLIEWDNLAINDNKEFKCWTPNKAKKEFLKLYKQLFK
jgi:hypothetical protein